MSGSLASSITANFSFANYTAERRRELIKMFSCTAFAMMLLGVPLLAVDFYLAALFGVSGLMFFVMAGGVDVSDRIIKNKERRVYYRFHTAVKTYVSQTRAYTRAYTRNRARSHRSTSRPTFSSSSKSNSDSGESDSGDPPGPQSSVTPSLYSSKKPNHSPLPWQSPGCWCMGGEHVDWRWLA